MRMVRWAGLVALIAAVIAVAGPGARAADAGNGRVVPADKRLGGMTGGQLIGEETRLLLELPLAVNPLAGRGGSCFSAGNVLIVWTRPQPPTCTVKPGTPVFLFGGWVFCDPVEPPPYFAIGEEAQRKCALEGVPRDLVFDEMLVSIDGGEPVDIGTDRYLAVSPQGTAQLPPGNVLGAAPQPMTFVTAGYVAMIRPLTPGRHSITVEIVGGAFAGTTAATIDVVPGA